MSVAPDTKAFFEFFDGPFQRELEAVHIPGAPDASWDRKAAWLLWCERVSKPASPKEATILRGGLFD